MAPALPKALAPEKMTLRQLARTWARELGYEWPQVEHALVEAALNGQLDGQTAATGLLFRSHENFGLGPITGARLREMIAGDHAASILNYLRKCENLAVHRDAVLAFAQHQHIKPPSWWKAAPGRSVEQHKGLPHGEAEKWFATRIGGWSGETPPPSEADDQTAFEAHLGRKVSRDEFREVRRRLVPSNWLRRGRRARNSRMKFAAK
jgi:hypothetical protein